ncbi:MAG: hypothetical protein NTU44_19565 [Bacteroidetes bacterium]|nr:hypothetical protein [Bacteroidota bacterium]
MKHIVHVAAVLIFAVITLIQFSPLFSGRVVNQHDISQSQGASKEISDYRATEHKEPLWTNSMFGGMPAYQISTLYPGNKMDFADKLFHLFLPNPAGYVFMYFLGFYILLLCLGVSPWLALVGSLAYGFSSYFYIIIEVGHNSKANAIGYLAPLLGGIILLMRKKYWLGFVVTALFMALELNTNHLQITYYGLMLFLLVFIAYFIQKVREKQLKSFIVGIAIFMGATAIAVLPNAGSILCTYEYSQYTTRGKTELTIDVSGKSNSFKATSGLDKDYAVQYSYGVSETFSFLIPNFKGGSSSAPISSNKSALNEVKPELRELVGQFGSYFGPQEFIAGPVYIGAIVILLAFLGLFIVDHPTKWALFIGTLLAVMLAWGKNFMGLSSFFLDYFPGYNKFRAVSIINILAELTIPLLAVLAMDKLIRTVREGKPFQIRILSRTLNLKKLLILSFIVTGGFCLVSALLPTTLNSFTSIGEKAEITGQFVKSGYPENDVQQIMPEFMDNLVKARISIFTSDAWRSLLFIFLAGLALMLFVMKKINTKILLVAIGILLVSDLWPVAFRYLNNKSFVPRSKFYAQPKTAADEQILRDTSLDYRVLNIAASPFQDAKTSYYHKSIGGYHGAKLKKYHELMEFHLFSEINEFNNGIYTAYTNDSARNALFGRLGVLNMLNTKYIIYPTREEPVVFHNPEANGNVWFVRNIKIVQNADSEILSLSKTNLKTTCVVQQKNSKDLSISGNYSARGNILLKSYKPDQLIYETTSPDKQFAVFSEIYYPKGWKASIDNIPASFTCVNYLLRGMEIPAGNHSVEFRFDPGIYRTGNAIAYAGSILLLISLIVGFFFAKKTSEI